jgi:hypothetical protein
MALQYDKTYFWRVDSSYNNSSATDPNTITGPVWTFSTHSGKPACYRAGRSDRGALGRSGSVDVFRQLRSVRLSVMSGISPWMRLPIRKTMTMVSGAETDDTVYRQRPAVTMRHTIIALSRTKAVSPSSVAKLGVQRRVAHWSWTALVGGQYADNSGEGRHADPNGTPVFTTGRIE